MQRHKSIAQSYEARSDVCCFVTTCHAIHESICFDDGVVVSQSLKVRVVPIAIDSSQCGVLCGVMGDAES